MVVMVPVLRNNEVTIYLFILITETNKTMRRQA